MRNKRKAGSGDEGRTHPQAAGLTRSESREVIRKVDEIRDLLTVKRTAESLDLVDLLRSRRRLMVNNLLLGLARGVGFFLGVSLVGALIVGIAALTIAWIEGAFGWEKGTTQRYLDAVVGEAEFLQTSGEGSAASAAGLEDAVREVLREEGLITGDGSPAGEGESAGEGAGTSSEGGPGAPERVEPDGGKAKAPGGRR